MGGGDVGGGDFGGGDVGGVVVRGVIGLVVVVNVVIDAVLSLCVDDRPATTSSHLHNSYTPLRHPNTFATPKHLCNTQTSLQHPNIFATPNLSQQSTRSFFTTLKKPPQTSNTNPLQTPKKPLKHPTQTFLNTQHKLLSNFSPSHKHAFLEVQRLRRHRASVEPRGE